jgi:hypothetical protein
MNGESHFTHSALLHILKQLRAQASSWICAMDESGGLWSPSKESSPLASLRSRFCAAGSDNRPLEPEMIPQAEKHQLALLEHLCVLQSRISSLQKAIRLSRATATVTIH